MATVQRTDEVWSAKPPVKVDPAHLAMLKRILDKSRNADPESSLQEKPLLPDQPSNPSSELKVSNEGMTLTNQLLSEILTQLKSSDGSVKRSRSRENESSVIYAVLIFLTVAYVWFTTILALLAPKYISVGLVVPTLVAVTLLGASELKRCFAEVK